MQSQSAKTKVKECSEICGAWPRTAHPIERASDPSALKILVGAGAGNPDARKWRVSGYAHRMDGKLQR
jgi:hypothetical protein